MNPPDPSSKMPKVGLVLTGGASEAGGGTGRRFARLFRFFQQNPSSADVWLITRPEFLALMERSSIGIDPNHNVVHLGDGAARVGASPLARLADHRDTSARLAKLAIEGGFDLIHIPSPSLVYAPYLLRKEDDDIRTVFSMTAAVGSFESMNWKAQLLYRIGFECSDAIDTLYRDIATRFPSYASKIKVSPCSFTDHSRYQPADEKQKWIVFAGRLEPFKNPHLFVEAANLAADTLRELGWKCLLYGDGELRASVEERIAQLDLSDLIETNQAADLSPVLNRSMVFASIQQTENYPSQVLLEAMAAGNAIIATDVGETRRIVDEEVGLLFPEPDPHALALAMTTLARDTELREKLASHARSRVLDQHNIAKFAQYMNALWKDALSAKARVMRPSWVRLASMAARGAIGLKFY